MADLDEAHPDADDAHRSRTRHWPTTDPAEIFALVAGCIAVVALIAAVVAAIGLLGSSQIDVRSDGDEVGLTPDDGDEGSGPPVTADPTADPAEIIADSAAAMADVTSVEFALERTGSPIFIDQFGSIALDSLIGQFTVPGRAIARLDVEVDGNLSTRIGAVAIDDEVWISNPVTGTFETLPAGYDIDPSRFFDPEGGWQPLLANLSDVELVGIEDRGDERYHVRGVAPAAEVRNITVGLVRDQDVVVDLWIDPSTSLVTAAEFTTSIDGADANWTLELGRYGDEFTIEPPPGVDTEGG